VVTMGAQGVAAPAQQVAGFTPAQSGLVHAKMADVLNRNVLLPIRDGFVLLSALQSDRFQIYPTE